MRPQPVVKAMELTNVWQPEPMHVFFLHPTIIALSGQRACYFRPSRDGHIGAVLTIVQFTEIGTTHGWICLRAGFGGNREH